MTSTATPVAENRSALSGLLALRKVIHLNDDRMIGPGMHEQTAQNALIRDSDEAAVHAMLAIASAINRLADAVNDYVASQQ